MKTFRSRFQSLLANPVMGEWNGELYLWPQVKGWQLVDLDQCNAFNWCYEALYQHEESGQLVQFNARERVESAGKKVGSYALTAYGFKKFGSWRTTQSIAGILYKMEDLFPELLAEWKATLPDYECWERVFVDDTGIVLRTSVNGHALSIILTPLTSDLPYTLLNGGMVSCEILWEKEPTSCVP